MTDDRSARLAARSEALREKVARQRQALEWAEQRTATVQGSAASNDGLIRAVVDSTGLLTQLELASGVRAAQPAELARAITVVVQRAAAHARGQVMQTYDGLRNEGVINELPAGLLPIPSPQDGPVTLLSTSAVTPSRLGREVEQATPRTDEDEGPPSTWMVRRQ